MIVFLNVFVSINNYRSIIFELQNNYNNWHILGAYIPLTEEGNIVVDGVLASCYASFDHDLAHITMAPIQWFPEIIENIFGKEKSSLAYVSIIKELGRWLLPYGQLLTSFKKEIN